MLYIAFLAGFLYSWFLYVFVNHVFSEPDKPHWSEQDWWTGRHAHMYDDLQEKDRPHLFDKGENHREHQSEPTFFD